MLGAMKQWGLQSVPSYGNATISGTATLGNISTNTVSNQTYITFTNYATESSAVAAPYWSNYSNSVGSFTISGNTALVDILLVGAGGATYAGGTSGSNIGGGNGGEVRYLANVTLRAGTYPVFLGKPTTLGGNGVALFNKNGTIVSSQCGGFGYQTTYPVGGAGNFGLLPATTAVDGANGQPSPFGSDTTWLYSDGNAVPYFGAGGGGVWGWQNSSGDILSGNGGYLGAGTANDPGAGRSPDAEIITQGLPNFGAGQGAGDPGNTDFVTGNPGSGVIIIRHRSS